MALRPRESNSSAEKESIHQSAIGEPGISILHSPRIPLTDEVEALARKVFRKFDLVLVLPVLMMFFLLSFIDRVNIGNARIAGLQTDLKLSDHQYSFALTITYIPFIAIEIPAGLILKRVGANILLPTMVTLWGLVATLQGVVTTYHGLLVARFFLGLTEGGLIPGLIIVMSRFYRRDQIHLRMALLFTATSLTGGFSGLLASAILGMDGRAGHRGWQWIFILEGIFTVVFGLLSFFILPRTPTSSQFLTEEEKKAITAALEHDWTPDSEEEAFSWRHVTAAFKTPHVLILTLGYFFSGNMIFSLAYFAPTIIRSMGYSAIRTQLMSVPPYAATFVFSVAVAILSDRWGQRGYTVFLAGLLAMTGYILFLTSTSTSVLYGSIFLQTMGGFTFAPAMGAWNANNVQPHYKRATALALGMTTGNFGALLSTWIYDDAPRFAKGTKINLAFSIGVCVLAVVNRAWLVAQNKRKEGERVQRRRLGSEAEEVERRRLGDDHPDFIYTL